ncbi:3-hydroxyacyl-CoA dehydrogenase family protein [Pseudopedobacter beijingensis]|uniref:3-hydroxyacyl-CoA dehydrogenase family protein n=1 Tax=Pseudopedobacter beijingensis TaxID=1207056 RepID=A0ABW4IET7_9SPHI
MNTENIPVAVVGLGLMGCGIATCLLMAKHPVIALAPIESDLDHVISRIKKHLIKSKEQGLISEDYNHYLANLKVTQNYSDLSGCGLVIECIIEDFEIKRTVYAKIESHISKDCLLTSNTSAIPISELQKLTQYPKRFLGLHWAEPSHTTRFLEIICGDLTDVSLGEYLYKLAHKWGKEPTLVRKDIRGFIVNRLMYAMYREAFYLVENGYATVEDVDRACRNNAGYWMTLVGIFRWMDLTGVPAYLTVMKDLWPTLSNATEVPKLIQDIVDSGGRGVSNANGFHEYTREEAELWENTFEKFSYEIRELASRYPHDVVSKQL